MVFGPPPIELGSLFVGKREFSVPLGVGEALPKSDGQFSSIAGRKLQQLGQRMGFHAVILSRSASRRNRGRGQHARAGYDGLDGPTLLVACLG